MSMFAKRQSALAAAAGSPPAARGKPSLKPVVAALKKPPVIAGLSGLFLLSATALFLTVLGDPRAGTPSARIALHREEAAPAPAPTGFEAFSMGAMGLYQDLTGTGDPSGAAGGEAVITLPDGATVAGGASYSAPVQAASPLAKAPIAGLSQPGPSGPLPMIAPDGRVLGDPFPVRGPGTVDGHLAADALDAHQDG